jgi:hypothetical protein
MSDININITKEEADAMLDALAQFDYGDIKECAYEGPIREKHRGLVRGKIKQALEVRKSIIQGIDERNNSWK